MAREWFRHTIGFARNEVSRRYVDDEPSFHIPEELRERAPNKKQGSKDGVHPYNSLLRREYMEESVDKSVRMYNSLLKEGVCPEQARMILPQCMMTEFIETGSLAAYARLCHLRMGSDAQKEIQDVAKMVSDAMAIAFPESWCTLMREAI
jgi:thymidylate synthase (FAD)